MSLVKLGKFVSLALRHQPEKAGITLDAQGWADVAELLAGARRNGVMLDKETLDEIVAVNDKQRFAYSDDGLRIRARQGHSLAVDLQFQPRLPPDILYHGTAQRFLEAICAQGLHKRSRQYVHLSADIATALKVGKRHGQPAVVEVQAGKMYAGGMVFYLSENGVWLTDTVPAFYVRVIQT